jgi:hypothetical protein
VFGINKLRSVETPSFGAKRRCSAEVVQLLCNSLEGIGQHYMQLIIPLTRVLLQASSTSAMTAVWTARTCEANDDESPGLWSRTRASKNLKPCGCRTYKHRHPINPASVGPQWSTILSDLFPKILFGLRTSQLQCSASLYPFNGLANLVRTGPVARNQSLSLSIGLAVRGKSCHSRPNMHQIMHHIDLEILKICRPFVTQFCQDEF